MRTTELVADLERAEVDPDRYSVTGQPPRTPWRLPREDQVILVRSMGNWEVHGGSETVPGWTGVLRGYASEDEACQDFLRELTRADAGTYAEAKAEWVGRAARLRVEAEQRLAEEEPERFALRGRWAEERGRRQAVGEPLMTRRELAQGLAELGAGVRGSYWIAGVDPVRGQLPRMNVVEPVGGEWQIGQWDLERPWFVPECTLPSEGDLCAYVFDRVTAHWSVPAVLTLDQWRRQRARQAEVVALQEQWRTEKPSPGAVPRTHREIGICLYRAGVPYSRFWTTGYEPRELSADAWLLLWDPIAQLWRVEPDGSPESGRSFGSEAEACAAVYRALTE